jgi:uncharacterized coiled-coil DUF342 family protein
MSNEKNESSQWFLRIAGGTVFGPVSTKGLIVWAEQGRIVPGNEVSNDRETWLPAETVPELEMNWHVKAGAKTEGPFNRIAAESFLRSGKAPPGATLVETKGVDPALPVRRNATDEAAETPPASVVAAKPPANGRHAAVKTAETKSEADARDRRIAELEAALEKQRETIALARQAAKTQSALEDERDELRRQMQELQAQMERFRANSDKDAQKRERKLDALKQEMARLQQEQEAAKTRPPMLELDPADASPPAADEDPQQALDELRRQAEDERRALERDAELLRARIRKLETELAHATAAAEEARARAAQPPAIDPKLQQTCDALRTSLAEAQSANEALRAQTGKLDQRVGELASQVGQLETECSKLANERENLQNQLGVAMSAATDATNEAANGELRRRVEQLEAVNEGLRTELTQADQDLTAERASLAELLAASNERDMTARQRTATFEQRQAELENRLKELGTASERETKLSAEVAAARTRIAELQGRLARLPETSAAERVARSPEADDWLRQFATDELTVLDKALHEERQSFNGFRELSAARQEAIQTRIQVIQKLLSGDFHADGRLRATTAVQRIASLDQSRLQSEVDSMRESQQKELKQYEEREGELLRRIRVLENEDARLRSLMETTDMESGRKLELMETVRRREQELAQERRTREQDREQFQSAQQALLRRIEELEHAAGGATGARPAGEDKADPAPKPARFGKFGNWLKR